MMQTERELLELAARAAGIEIEPCTCSNPKTPFRLVGRAFGSRLHWNPLNDDGDALRLATACYMTVCADGTSTVSACSGYGHDRVMVTQELSGCGGDKSAATRRAIVRAAAALAQETQSHD